MIGTLKGIVSYREDPAIIVEVHDVGYRVLVPSSVMAKAVLGEEIKLHIHTHVREDVLELYGFTAPEDLRMFAYLIGVSGVGCRTALGIFSVAGRREIMQAIANNDVNFFTAVPRLGKKNAQKIIIELKNKIGGQDIDLGAEDQATDDVVAALKVFGFTTSESQAALRSLNGQGSTTEEKIKLALKYLGK